MESNALLMEIIWYPVEGYDILTKEIIYCQRKWYPVISKDILSKETFFCQVKWDPVKGNDFLWQEIIPAKRNLVLPI